MGKRGPQPFTPSKTQRKLVKLLVAGGIPEPVIAHKIGVCQNTLRRHFPDELVFGRGLKLAENIERLDKAADGGNVTAMKHLDAKFEMVSAKASFTDPLPAEPTRKLGKKELQRNEAMVAGDNSDWGSDLKPPSSLPN